MKSKPILRSMIAGALSCLLTVIIVQAQQPEIGKAARYCNPLPMVIGPGGNASGDVSVFKEYKGGFYQNTILKDVREVEEKAAPQKPYLRFKLDQCNS